MILTILCSLVIGQVPFLPDSQEAAYARRAHRERAVARIGPCSRPLVEAFEQSATALDRCSPAVGVRLCECYSSGVLSRWPNLPAFLVKVGSMKNGADDCVLWAINHAELLVDPDNFAAYLENPSEIFLQLSTIEQMASAHRARKLSYVTRTGLTPEQQKVIFYTAVVGGLLALAWWRWKKKPTTVNSLAPRAS